MPRRPLHPTPLVKPFLIASLPLWGVQGTYENTSNRSQTFGLCTGEITLALTYTTIDYQEAEDEGLESHCSAQLPNCCMNKTIRQLSREKRRFRISLEHPLMRGKEERHGREAWKRGHGREGMEESRRKEIKQTA